MKPKLYMNTCESPNLALILCYLVPWSMPRIATQRIVAQPFASFARAHLQDLYIRGHILPHEHKLDGIVRRPDAESVFAEWHRHGHARQARPALQARPGRLPRRIARARERRVSIHWAKLIPRAGWL